MKPYKFMNPCRINRLLLAVPLGALLHSIASGQTTIPQAEPDDSIPTANATGITPGFSGFVKATGNNGDGEYGGIANKGDTDFFKMTLSAGQIIQVHVKNGSDNDDFDSAVGIFNSAGVLVEKNDDVTGGTNRSSRLSYLIPADGDYYVCVSNWLNVDGGNDDTNYPSDPMTPGTTPGAPGGTPGPYILVIGVDSTLPVVEYDGTSGVGNPRPVVYYTKTSGTPRYTGKLRIKNTGLGPLTITAASITGPDAAKFTLMGLVTPVSIPADGAVDLFVKFNSGGSNALATATLALTSNEPLGQTFTLKARGSLLKGGGFFTVRELQDNTGSFMGDWTVAGQVLDGTLASTETTDRPLVLNYANSDPQGFFPGDRPFPTPADNFVTESKAILNVTEPGLYSFRAYTDDGQRLYIDNSPVGLEYTDANVAHFYTANLAAGQHTLTFQHFEGGGAEGLELAVAQEPGTFTGSGQTTWELLESYSPDTDGDGIPDDWEYSFFPGDLTKLTATGDYDHDGLPDAQEYTRGTSPLLADTDGDGLPDRVETDTGVWVSAEDTGTDPNNRDTDGDYALDGQETNTGVYVSPGKTGTNPLRPDTDGDGILDGLEGPYGANPLLASSVPKAGALPLLIAWWPFNDATDPLLTRDAVAGIAGINGGTYTPDGEGRGAQEGDRAMLFSSALGQVVDVKQGSFMNIATGGDSVTISFWQKLITTGNSSSFWVNSPSSAEAVRGIQAHSPWGDNNIYFDTGGATAGPTRISGPVPGGVNLYEWTHFAFVKSGDRKQVWVNGALAVEGGGDALKADITSLTIGGGQNNYTNGYLDDFAVFAGGLDAAQIGRLYAGESPEAIAQQVPAPFGITGVTINADSSVNLTWDSLPGKTYTLEYSTDLTTWATISANVPATGGISTTATVPGKFAPGKVFFRVGY